MNLETASSRTILRDPLAEPNREDKDHYQQGSNHVHDRCLIWSKEVVEDPQWQGFGTRTSCKGGHDNLIEGESKGKQSACNERGTNQWKSYIPKGLEDICTKIL